MPNKITRSSKLHASSFSIPFLGTKRRVTFGLWARTTREAQLPDPGQGDDTYDQYEYDYLPDRHIRILDLQPGNGEAPLSARLRTIPLDDDGEEYQSLSYVWGSPQYGPPGVGPSINLGSGSLPILPNLENALRAIRTPTETVHLWVDALCINQQDIEERNRQVQYMAEIYSTAHTVRVWLGRETESSVLGMEVLAFLAGNRPFEESPWHRTPPEEIACAVRGLLGRDYFARVWVVQEAALSRRVQVQVGSITIDWLGGHPTRRFLARIKLAEISPSWEEPLQQIDFRPLTELLEQSVSYANKQQGRVEPPSLLDIVHGMRHRKATDPRDKIYAMMGLALPDEVAGFVPDYSTTWQETYQRFYALVERQIMDNPDAVLEDIRAGNQDI